MNRLNQTEPATFSILPRWASFDDSYFTLFSILFFHRFKADTVWFFLLDNENNVPV
jgi:hypothetical protein